MSRMVFAIILAQQSGVAVLKADGRCGCGMPGIRDHTKTEEAMSTSSRNRRMVNGMVDGAAQRSAACGVQDGERLKFTTRGCSTSGANLESFNIGPTWLSSVPVGPMIKLRLQPYGLATEGSTSTTRQSLLTTLFLQDEQAYLGTSGQQDPCDVSVPHVQRFPKGFNDTHRKVQGTQSQSTAKWLRARHKTSIIAPDSRQDARLRTLF